MIWYCSIIIIIIIIIIKRGLAVQGWERVIYTLSVRRPQLHNTNLYKQKVEKWKYGWDRAAYANKKALALLWKPTSPTTSNTELAR